MYNKKTNHRIEPEEHEDFCAIIEEAIMVAKENNYPLHMLDLLNGILGEGREYEEDGEEPMEEPRTENTEEDKESEETEGADKKLFNAMMKRK